MKSTVLPLNIWHGSVLWNFSSLRCHVFCELTFKQCFNRFLNDSVHLKLPVLRLLVYFFSLLNCSKLKLASEYSSTPLTVVLCEHSLKTQSMFPGVQFPAPDSVPFLYMLLIWFLQRVLCFTAKWWEKCVLLNISLCVSALPSIKCNSDLSGWQALIVSLKKVSNTW